MYLHWEITCMHTVKVHFLDAEILIFSVAFCFRNLGCFVGIFGCLVIFEEWVEGLRQRRRVRRAAYILFILKAFTAGICVRTHMQFFEIIASAQPQHPFVSDILWKLCIYCTFLILGQEFFYCKYMYQNMRGQVNATLSEAQLYYWSSNNNIIIQISK